MKPNPVKIPAICRVGSNTYGGHLEWAPMSRMGYTFTYIARSGKVTVSSEKFECIARAHPDDSVSVGVNL